MSLDFFDNKFDRLVLFKIFVKRRKIQFIVKVNILN
jgi:hypothetical protein